MSNSPRPDGARRALPVGPVLQLSSLVPPAHFGGAERVIGWLTEELQRSGLAVHNAGLSPRPPHPLAGDHPIRNVYWPFDDADRPVVSRAAWHAIDALTLRARRDVESLVRTLAPSVLVTHQLRGWGFAPWVVAAQHGIPIVHVIHDFGLICNTSAMWKGGNCETLCRSCRWRRDATSRRWPGGDVVGVSRAVLAVHSQHGLAFAASAPVAYPTGAAAPLTPVPLRAHDLQQPPHTLGYLGRLTEAKGLQLLLGAVRATSQRLIVAGDTHSSYARSLREGPTGDVTWLGWVDPAALFEQVDVLVVPSVWREPFGLVVVEAARAGLPVLAADQPGLEEAARASGARYLSFAASDEAALRAALRRPLADYQAHPVQEATEDLVGVIVRAAGAPDQS